MPTITRSAPAASAAAIASSRAVAAADLEWKPAGRRDALDEPERRRAGERSVEVDEMQPPRAFVAEPAGELDGVASLDRDRLAPSL